LSSLQDFSSIVNAPTSNDHQAAIACDRKFGIAKIDSWLVQECCRIPLFSIDRRENSQAAVATDMIIGLTKTAIPMILKSNEIRKGVMVSLIPDLSDRNDFCCNSKPADNTAGNRNEQESYRQVTHI
jgi:hypothetical protein